MTNKEIGQEALVVVDESPFTRDVSGNPEDYTLTLKAKDWVSTELRKHLGRRIEAVLVDESWEREGQEDDDTHSSTERRYVGELSEVSDYSFTLKVMQGEREVLELLPFFQSKFQKKSYRKDSFVTSLKVDGLDFWKDWWGRAPLTQEETMMVRDAMRGKCAADDRYPDDVIAEDYGGNEDLYLKVMAGWHNVWPKIMEGRVAKFTQGPTR